MNKRWPAALAVAGLAWYASDSLRHRREGGRGYQLRGAALDVGSPEFLRAAEALTSAPISHGNQVDVFVNGDEIFPVFLETIAGAQRTLNVLTYIYWSGEIANEVAGALAAKAREGVQVNVLLDAMGTVQMESGLIEQLHRGAHDLGRPAALDRLELGQVALADEHVAGRFEPVLGERALQAEDGRAADAQVRAGVGDTNVEALYYLAIACARESLELTSAYFAPRPAFVAALADAARRGVAVRILVPGEHIDKAFVLLAGRQSYDALLDAGARIFEYGPTMLHAKVMTVDGRWSTVGSVNFDNRSFQLHDEATLCLQSERFCAELTDQFQRDLAVSEEITLERWRARPLHARARERVLTLARREL